MPRAAEPTSRVAMCARVSTRRRQAISSHTSGLVSRTVARRRRRRIGARADPLARTPRLIYNLGMAQLPALEARGLTAAVQDYAKAIYTLESRDGEASTTALATLLEVRPASVSGML